MGKPSAALIEVPIPSIEPVNMALALSNAAEASAMVLICVANGFSTASANFCAALNRSGCIDAIISTIGFDCPSVANMLWNLRAPLPPSAAISSPNLRNCFDNFACSFAAPSVSPAFIILLMLSKEPSISLPALVPVAIKASLIAWAPSLWNAFTSNIAIPIWSMTS